MFESLLCVSDFSFHCDSSFSAIFEPSTYTQTNAIAITMTNKTLEAKQHKTSAVNGALLLHSSKIDSNAYQYP